MKTIYAHPQAIEAIRKITPGNDLGAFAAAAGVPVVASPYMEPFRWEPPANDRFVTYEPRDHGWLRALGFGSMEPVFYVVDQGAAFKYLIGE